MDRERLLARLVVQLTREDAGRYMLVNEIVDRALVLTDVALKARQALERGRSPARHFKKAAAVAAEFGADIRPIADPASCVLGIRFRSGRYTESPSGVFFVV